MGEMRSKRSRRGRGKAAGKNSPLFPNYFKRSSSRRTARETAGLSFEQLEPRLALAVVISEFLADNADGITDFAGEHHDWIELVNTGASAVDVAGWHLTDDALNLTKWEIPSDPSTALAPGEYLTIFASDKDGVYSGELHTNFKLTTAGEYLGLVMADGTTVASDFGTAFPEQFTDVSYGTGATTSTTTTDTLVGASSPLTVISPTSENAARDDHWREIGFDDSTWLTGTGSVGFDRNSDAPNLLPYINRVLTTGEMDSTDSTPQYSAYVRYEFDVTNKDQLTSLELELMFDDGFIAYLNDREIYRVNFAEDFVYSQPMWSSYAGNQMGTSSTAGAANRVTEADDLVPIDLSPYVSSLEEGTNVLAFHLVNYKGSTTSALQDLLVAPVLTAERATGTAASLYMAAPTPGADNGLGTLGFVEDTQFSVDRGFYDATQYVEITTPTADAVIRYTTDGSVPTLANGTTYTGAITVDTTTTLRAAAFKTGYTPTNVDTQTYIFVADVIGQDASDVTETYATWGHDKDDGDTTSGYNLDDESDWAMDTDIVGGVETAQAVMDALKAIPTVSIVMDWDDLFSGTPMPGTFPAGSAVAPAPQGIYIHGRSSERSASMEYINPDVTTDQFQIDASVEIQGHSSPGRWNSDKLSFQVKFKYPYGSTELDYPLFANSPDGANAVTEFDQLILDAMYNYTWIHSNTSVQDNYARFVTDQVTSDLQNLASNGGSHGEYVQLYLNGLYWGMYNLHERPDDSYAAEYYGGDKDDYYVIKHANNDINHEYTWVEGGIAAEQAYNDLLLAARAVESNPTSAAAYAAVEDILDIDQFIDYMVVHYYVGDANDWAHNNWYATFDAADPNGKWRFHSWDQEHAFPTTDNGDSFTQTTDLTTKDDFECSTEILQNLIVNEEFRLRFSDRVQELMYNDGVLTESAAQATYEARTDEIDQAIIAESARWGDNRVYADPYTRADFITTKNNLLAAFFPVRTSTVLGHFDSRGWIPTLDAPLFNQYGGEVTSGFDLVITKPGGSPSGATIYYTTDGSDPRLVGGAISGSAVAYSGAIDITDSTQVQARIYYNNSGTSNDWSPIIDESFLVPEPFPVRIVELMYNPADPGGVVDEQDLEFFELLNTGTSTVSLDGLKIGGFIAGGTYDFPTGLTLDAGERIVVARDPVVFESVYGTGINLSPTGYVASGANLGNGGEEVTLISPSGQLLQDFFYDDVSPWPTSPDGTGPSLEYIGPLDADAADPTVVVGDPYDDAANWQASANVGGSPGTDGSDTNEVPVITSDGGGATASVNAAENQTAVTTVTATDADVPPDTLTFSITGGADQLLFDIGSSSGVLTFDTAKDYESPTDANLDGVYLVEVTVDDGNGGTDVQAISVTVTNVNEAPVITSNGGGATASVNALENQTAVTTVTSTDVDGGTPAYSIIGGADQSLFNIGSSSGVLTFEAAPDYENPMDADTNGVYEVTVQVSDGNGGTDTQAISVTVTDETEATLAGDYDGSGTVDDDDWIQWKSDFGTTVTPAGSGSDGNGDGYVDAADYTVWRDNFGATLGAGSGSIVASVEVAAAVVAPVEEEALPTSEAPAAVDDLIADVQLSMLPVELPAARSLATLGRSGDRVRVTEGTHLQRWDLLRKADRVRDNLRVRLDAAFETTSAWLRQRGNAGVEEDVLAAARGQDDSGASVDVWEDAAWLQRLSRRRLG
jgi:hypothetical protein